MNRAHWGGGVYRWFAVQIYTMTFQLPIIGDTPIAMSAVVDMIEHARQPASKHHANGCVSESPPTAPMVRQTDIYSQLLISPFSISLTSEMKCRRQKRYSDTANSNCSYPADNK